MGMEEKKPVEITENSSDQAKNKAESNPWLLLFLYPDFSFFQAKSSSFSCSVVSDSPRFWQYLLIA